MKKFLKTLVFCVLALAVIAGVLFAAFVFGLGEENLYKAPVGAQAFAVCPDNFTGMPVAKYATEVGGVTEYRVVFTMDNGTMCAAVVDAAEYKLH